MANAVSLNIKQMIEGEITTTTGMFLLIMTLSLAKLIVGVDKKGQRYAFDLLMFNALPTPLPVFPNASRRSACFRVSSLYALLLGWGVYLHLQLLQYIR